MKTPVWSAAKSLLTLIVVASLLLTATACETTTVEPTAPKIGKPLPKGTFAEDPPEKPIKPPGE